MRELTGREKWATRAIAVACVIVVVAAGASYLTRPSSQPAPGGTSTPVQKPVGDFGPKVMISGEVASWSLANNTSVSIQIFSTAPVAFETPTSAPYLHLYPISGRDQWSNGVDEELLNITIVPEGTFDNGSFTNATAFFLSPSFDSIDTAWETLLSRDTGKNYPSMTVEAEKTITRNGSVAIYSYYNNLLYNPFSLQLLGLNATSFGAATWFQGTEVEPANYSQITIAAMTLNLSVDFGNTPTQVVPLPALASTQINAKRIAAPHSPAPQTGSEVTPDTVTYYYSYPSTTSDTLEHTSYANGTLPLLGVSIGQNAASGNSIISLGASTDVQSDTISLNSNQVYQPASGETTTSMSTTPSFAHVANITTGSDIGTDIAIPLGISETLGNNLSVSLNRTTAFVGIQGVEYAFDHYNQYTYNYADYWELICMEENGYYYCDLPKLISQTLKSTVYDGNLTTGGIVHINSTAGLQVNASYESIWVAWTVQHTLLSSSNGTIQLTTSGSDSAYSASTIWGDTYGYSNASGAYSQASQAFASFSTGIGLALTVIAVASAANGLDFDSTEPAVVAACTAIAASVLATTSAILNQFSSISFVSGSQSATFTYGFSNDPAVGSGSSYSMPFYESTSPVKLTADGVGYSYYAPEDYLNVTAIG